HTSNDGFVSALYVAVLGRQADASGAGVWTTALNSGALTRADVAGAFLGSGESLRYLVDSYYAAFFHPHADAAAFWVGLLANGGFTPDVAAAAFAASAEFTDGAAAAAH